MNYRSVSPDANEEKEEITRRTFCNRALLSSAALVLAASEFKAKSTKQQENLVFYPPMKIEGAERLLPGSFLYFEYPKRGDGAILLRGSEGEFSAYSRKCAHLGCSIEFDDSRRCLFCPCHRGAYDARTGFVIFGPPPRPLDQIVLQMRDCGEVWAVGRRIGSSNNNA